MIYIYQKMPARTARRNASFSYTLNGQTSEYTNLGTSEVFCSVVFLLGNVSPQKLSPRKLSRFPRPGRFPSPAVRHEAFHGLAAASESPPRIAFSSEVFLLRCFYPRKFFSRKPFSREIILSEVYLFRVVLLLLGPDIPQNPPGALRSPECFIPLWFCCFWT